MAGFGLDFILMNYFSFLFIQVYNAARLCWILLLFEFFLVILETPLCLLLLTKTLRLLEVFRLLHMQAGTDVSIFRKPIAL
jgi:hypothetical protein